MATEEPVLPVERSASSVRSLERAFELLEHLADAGGQLALTELAEVSGLPMPTIYRLMRTLVRGCGAHHAADRGPTRPASLGLRA